MWCYSQASGNLYDPSGVIIATGYSGNGAHKNDPASNCVKDQGPIPRGSYGILKPEDSLKHGPYAMELFPDVNNNMCGRDGFMIHGDSIEHPGLASDGCVILPRPIREGIWQSGDHILKVIAGLTNVEDVVAIADDLT